MKKIMIAALAVLMTLTLSVGGILPAFAAEHDHSAHVGALIGGAANVGASDADELGPDFSGYKPITVFPVTAEPINNIADFLAMQAHGVYYLNTDLVIPMSHPGLANAALYGNGHTITTNVPIFETIDDVEIYDLTICGEIKQAGNVGALAKEAYLPHLTGIINNADVTSTTNGYTGGLIGFVWHKTGEVSMRYCVNNGRIDNASAASGKADAGGLIGIVRGMTTGTSKNGVWTQTVSKYDRLIIEHCLNTGEVYGSNRIGGIVGVMGEASWLFGSIIVKNTANTGNITSTQHYVGGLTARLSGIDNVFENCINTGKVLTLAASKYGGGIVGLSEDPGVKVVFRNCRNEGEINMTTTAGGILGNGSKWGMYYGTGTTVENDGANIPASDFYFYDCVNVGAVIAGNNAGGMGLISTADELVVERCENRGTISGKDNDAGMFLQVGAANATFEDCYNSGNVTGGDAGGMIGEVTANNAKLTIRNCVNDGAITGGRPGGIVGCAESKTIKAQFIDCVNNGKIHSVTNYGGGIAGRFDLRVADGTVAGFESQKAVLFLRCVNNGEVEVFQSQAGGMVGYVDGTFDGSDANTTVDSGEVYNMEIRECLNTGYIHPTNLNKNVSVGGLAGNVDGRMEIYDSANTGKVHGGGGVGGIVGSAGRGATIHRCVNTGDVTGGVYAGGIAGRMGGEHLRNNEALYCVTTGLVTHSGANLTDKSYSAGGVVGYGWGTLNVKYCAALGNVVANYPATGFDTDGNRLTVGAICGYQNSAGGTYQNNYHSGTITVNGGNPNVIVIAAKQAPTNTVNNSDNKISNLFTAEAYPLYYHQATGVGTNNPDPDTWEITAAKSTKITQAVDSNDFLNTLNAAAGEGTFVMVTNCEGETFPIHKDTVNAFKMTLGRHADSSYYTKQNNDGENHWYECPVCGEIGAATVEAHKGGTADCQNKAVCSVCNEAYGEPDATNHVDPFTWVQTGTTHSADFSCCDNDIASEPHTFENGVCTVCEYVCLHDVDHEDNTEATCQNAAYCGICQMTYGEPDANNHTFADEWSFDDTTDKHYHACTNEGCEVRADEEACSGGDAKCNALAKCEVCDNSYGEYEAEDHSSDEFSYVPNADDATKHDVLHDCCLVLIETVEHGAENHVSDANCVSPAKCALCGEYGEKNPLNHAEEPSDYVQDPDDPARHLAVYGDCCGAELPEAHTGGTATCNKPATCSVCGLLYGEANGNHTYSGNCDESCDVCGAVRVPAAHTFGDWTVTKQPTETEYGTQERTCSECGKTQTASVSMITNSESALDSVTDQGGQKNYSWIGVLVIVGAGLIVIGVVVAFVVSKKRKAK